MDKQKKLSILEDYGFVYQQDGQEKSTNTWYYFFIIENTTLKYRMPEKIFNDDKKFLKCLIDLVSEKRAKIKLQEFKKSVKDMFFTDFY